MLVNDNLHDSTKLNMQEIKVVKRDIAFRHFAWLTALRHQLRVPKAWEIMGKRSEKPLNRLNYRVLEWDVTMKEELKRYLSEKELDITLSKNNKAAFILSAQNTKFKELLDSGNIDLFHQIELQGKLSELYDHQGKSERIKNFPYPRQYSSISKFFVILFILMTPFGLIGEFNRLAANSDQSYYHLFILLNIPCSALVMWIFWVLEKVGEASENPFEGGAGDIPITNMSLNIENDCRDILDIERIDIPTSNSKIIT